MIPDSLRPLFWDVNAEGFEPLKYPEYTILRVLEFGDAEAASWLMNLFPEARIAAVIRNDRRMSRRSANFWALAYNLRPEEVAALR